MKGEPDGKGLKEAEKIAESLIRDTITAISLERLFDRGATVAGGISPDARLAFDAVMVSLHSGLVLALMRMVDCSSDSASIPSFIRLFSDPRSISEMLVELEQFGRSAAAKSPLSEMPMFGHEWAETDARRRYLESAVSRLGKFTRIIHEYESLKIDKKFKCLKTLRHKAVAHTNLKTFKSDARWGYAGQVLHSIVLIVETIEEIALGRPPDFKGDFDEWTHHAERFWSLQMAQPSEH
jgi:hypothetical protein